MPPYRTATTVPPSSVCFPSSKSALYHMGTLLARSFCFLNRIPEPAFHQCPRDVWHVDACAYYRPDTEQNRKWMAALKNQGPGINICLVHCGTPCTNDQPRNWTWPGSTTDREPYGVVAHELGHHMDWIASEKKGNYGGDYSSYVMEQSGEKPISGYSPNPWEWFAEMARLFITNPDLLRQLRPRTYAIFLERWKPLIQTDWKTTLGENVPVKVLRTLRNKGAKG